MSDPEGSDAGPVISTAHELEYLLRAMESGAGVRDRHQLFLWVRGPLQALLPHRLLACVQLGPDDELLHAECLHSGVGDAALREALLHPRDGLVPRMARESAGELPRGIDGTVRDSTHARPRADNLEKAVAQMQLGHALLHGTERLAGGASFVALFGLRERPTRRNAYFFDLLLPHMHLALQRIRLHEQGPAATADNSAVTEREAQILHWVRQGKNNQEIGQILAISALTVKSHLQKIYRKLQVHNRAQAVSYGRP
jgi:transcriptional regulator EpsA